MNNTIELESINQSVLDLKKILITLEHKTDNFPALHRNTKRAQATIRMMELNLSDVMTIDLTDN